MPAETNRKSIDLPMEVGTEIIQKTQEQSAVMALARQITLPGRGVIVPVITGDPEADWVGETEKKKVAHPTLETKKMQAYKLAVIVPFSMEFQRDTSALYDALIARLPGALSKKFDGTVFGSYTVPGENFDTLKTCTAQEIGTDAYKGLVAATTDIAEHDGIANGFVFSPQGNAVLLNAVDANKRPLFINNVAEGAVPVILGVSTRQSKGAYVTDSAAPTVGFVGDWTKAVYGTVNGVQVAISDSATITDGGSTINLWEQNMFAVRAEIEIGFRCDTTVFNRLTKKATA